MKIYKPGDRVGILRNVRGGLVLDNSGRVVSDSSTENQRGMLTVACSDGETVVVSNHPDFVEDLGPAIKRARVFADNHPGAREAGKAVKAAIDPVSAKQLLEHLVSMMLKDDKQAPYLEALRAASILAYSPEDMGE